MQTEEPSYTIIPTTNANKINTSDKSSDVLKFARGIEIKRFQYEQHATIRFENPINIYDVLGITEDDLEVILINLPKDTGRYHQAVDEMTGKLGVHKFNHLLATYWRDRESLVADLSVVGQIITKNPYYTVDVNSYSEVTDPKIKIQDGPLACFISHVRALLWGITTRPTGYTLILEDDFVVTNTQALSDGLRGILGKGTDWDMIFWGSINLDPELANSPWHHITSPFHSSHAYLINNRNANKILERLYPVYDQIDVMISDSRNQLVIYNIPNCVYQRDIETNTQNNLDAIFHAPNYYYLRMAIGLIRDGLTECTNKLLIDSPSENTARIVQHFMTSIIYNTITNYADWAFDIELSSTAISVIPPAVGYHLNILITHCVKGKSVQYICNSIMNSCARLLIGLAELHNMDYLIHDGEVIRLQAYNFGSTCRTYKSFYNTDAKFNSQRNNIILKVYDPVPRWTVIGHVTAGEIFDNESRILCRLYEYRKSKTTDLQIQEPIINYQLRHILMPYAGLSLYDCPTALPENWEQQLTQIFDELSAAGIYYSEFNLANICVSDMGQISFIDFGLAKLIDPAENINNTNCIVFIELLTELMPRLQKETNLDEQYRLYQAFIRNKKTIQNATKGANLNIY